jgi:hypothetical protein
VVPDARLPRHSWGSRKGPHTMWAAGKGYTEHKSVSILVLATWIQPGVAWRIQHVSFKGGSPRKIGGDNRIWLAIETEVTTYLVAGAYMGVRRGPVDMDNMWLADLRAMEDEREALLQCLGSNCLIGALADWNVDVDQPQNDGSRPVDSRGNEMHAADGKRTTDVQGRLAGSGGHA